jgi:hypothetical protein
MMVDERFNAPRARDRIDAHREEAERLQNLAKQATTPRVKEHLEERAREHWELAVENGMAASE